MLRCIVDYPNNLIFEWDDSETASKTRRSTARLPSKVTKEAAFAIADAVARRVTRVSRLTGAYYGALRNIFSFISTSKESSFPPSNWGQFLLDHFTAHLETSKRTYEVTIATWHPIREIYEELIRSGLAPKDTKIPSATIKGLRIDDAIRPLGVRETNVEPPHCLAELLPKSCLLSVGLELPDDAYLLQLKTKLEHAAQTGRSCCLQYWETMLGCQATGKKLMSQISNEEIDNMLKGEVFFVNGQHVTEPATEGGISWFLATLRHYLKNTEGLEKLSFNQLAKIPFFKHCFNKQKRLKKRYRTAILNAAGKNRGPNIHIHETISRLLGLLSPRDCSVACAILIAENPSFTPRSLATSCLYNQNGKLYIRAKEQLSRLVFSVSKPRARKRKVSALPPLSEMIVNDVVRSTNDIREKLKHQKNGLWRRLFLPSTNRKFGATNFSRIGLGVTNGTTFYDIYSLQLNEAGITRSTFTLRSIRATQGIICFLEHGSLSRVANLLNNGLAVVRSNYIPSWLIIRWANRLLRVMQQKLIIVATKGTPWQLEASDFTSDELLVVFVNKMITELKHGDALSEVIRKRFASEIEAQVDFIEPFAASELIINLNPESLGMLYAYSDFVGALNDAQLSKIENLIDPIIPVKSLSALSRLVAEAADSIETSLNSAEHAVLDKIAGDSVAELVNIHQQAQIKKIYYTEMLANGIPELEQSS